MNNTQYPDIVEDTYKSYDNELFVSGVRSSKDIRNIKKFINIYYQECHTYLKDQGKAYHFTFKHYPRLTLQDNIWVSNVVSAIRSIGNRCQKELFTKEDLVYYKYYVSKDKEDNICLDFFIISEKDLDLDQFNELFNQRRHDDIYYHGYFNNTLNEEGIFKTLVKHLIQTRTTLYGIYTNYSKHGGKYPLGNLYK